MTFTLHFLSLNVDKGANVCQTLNMAIGNEFEIWPYVLMLELELFSHCYQVYFYIMLWK